MQVLAAMNAMLFLVAIMKNEDNEVLAKDRRLATLLEEPI